MGTTWDARQALTAMASVITAFTSAVVVSTSTINTSILQQVTNEGGVATGLTSHEVAIVTAISSAMGSAQPSSSIHNMAFSMDSRQLYAAMTSLLVALSSATGVTTGNYATQLSSMNAIDTGLNNQEKGLITTFITSLGSSSPATTAHSAG